MDQRLLMQCDVRAVWRRRKLHRNLLMWKIAINLYEIDSKAQLEMHKTRTIASSVKRSVEVWWIWREPNREKRSEVGSEGEKFSFAHSLRRKNNKTKYKNNGLEWWVVKCLPIYYHPVSVARLSTPLTPHTVPMTQLIWLWRDFLMVAEEIFSSFGFLGLLDGASHFLFSLDFLPRKEKGMKANDETETHKNVHGMKSETPKISEVSEEEIGGMRWCRWVHVHFLANEEEISVRFLRWKLAAHRHPQHSPLLSPSVSSSRIDGPPKMGWDNNIISFVFRHRRGEKENEMKSMTSSACTLGWVPSYRPTTTWRARSQSIEDYF